MMKIIIPIFFLSILLTYSQTDSTLTSSQLILDLLEEASIDLEEDFLYDLLEDLQDNPINLNTADLNTLLTIPFLDLNAAQNIISYRERFGSFFSKQELFAVEGLDLNLARALQFFTFIADGEIEDRPFIDLTDFSGEIRSRFMQDLQTRRGFNNGNYAGSELKSYQRAKLKFNNFNLAALIEKDPGETKFNDFASFSFSFNDYDFIKKITVGDYLIEFGQGLIYWGPYSFGKGSEAVRGITRSARSIRDYTSTDENQFFRGAAANVEFDNFDLTVFYSDNKRDANVNPETGEITSLPISGYHRTAGEISRYQQTNEKSIGGIVSAYLFDFITLGAAYQNIEYEHPIAQSGLFNPYGKSFNFYSTSYSIVYNKFRLSGEVAYNEISVASIHNLEWVLTNQLSFITSFRNYPRNFYTIKGTGFGESSNTTNEVGIYNGVRWRSDIGTINLYYDQFKFPYATFNSAYPSSGDEVLIDYQFRPVPRTLLNVRFKREKKEVTQRINNEDILLDQIRTNVRISYDYYVLRNLRFRTRIEYAFFDQAITDVHEKGYLILHDIRYEPVNSLRIYGRIVLFDTESYNSRVYQFENDLRGILTNPALFGKGTRWYMMVEYDLFDFARISAKYSELYKPNELVLSSGNNEISGNLDNRISVQLDIKF